MNGLIQFICYSKIREYALINLQAPERLSHNADFSSDLIAIARNQDRQAFQRIFLHFAPRIKTYLLRLGAPPSLAEDITQDTLATIWHKAHTFDPNKAEPSSWIFRIARNRRIDLVRRDRYDEIDEEAIVRIEDEEIDAETVIIRSQRKHAVETAFKILDSEQINLIHLSFFEEASHSDIASQLKLPIGTVKSKIRRAMQIIRAQLEGEV
ncbi:sigma-70 family RNA polymerase sigma factor [Microvirga sp. W0021]|uniref:RNA polymerase sigma factor n=1 Tax=Hohaiivirga grylli TaxID=3133970 RepID=A0ABV0BG86_9HYPH